MNSRAIFSLILALGLTLPGSSRRGAPVRASPSSQRDDLTEPEIQKLLSIH